MARKDIAVMGKRKYLVVGFHHIDLSWKRGPEEMAEMEEVFILRLLDLLDLYPDFRFAIEQASHFRNMMRTRPDLVERLKPHLKAGRLEFVGGMASTLETNIPCGESFVRNQAIGLKWVRENFDVEVRTGWLMDTFGINAQVPQILRQFGIRHVMANRLGGRKMHDVFLSKGLDGSQLLLVGRDVYSEQVGQEFTTFDCFYNWDRILKSFCDADRLTGPGPFLVGPHSENEVVISPHVRALLEERRATRDDESWAFATPSEYFKELDEAGTVWPVESGDLNPEFTGTFSLRTPIRVGNRKAENLLLEAEKWATLFGLSHWEEEIENAWWDLAYVQFHDVFTGSHPTNVYHHVMRRIASVEKTAMKILDRAFSTRKSDGADAAEVQQTELNQAELNQAEQNPAERKKTKLDQPESFRGMRQDSVMITAFNGLPWHRSALVTFPLPDGWRGVSSVYRTGESSALIAQSSDLPSAEGIDHSLPFDVLNGQVHVLAEIPPVGYRRFQLMEGPAPLNTQMEMEPATRKESGFIENEYIRLEFDDKFGLKKLIWKETGRVLLENAVDLLVVQRDDGNFQIEQPTASEVFSGAGEIRILHHEKTNAGESVRLSGYFPALSWAGQDSHLGWQVAFTLLRGKPRVDMCLKLDWKGESSRIRLKLATHMDTSAGIYEIPFGTVKRKPYGVTGTSRGEWPAHRFVAMEEGGYGLALVNTGTAGVEVNGGTILNTLIRAPKSEYAGMVADDSSSQHGTHEFAFALVPYEGSWRDSAVIQTAQELNNPVHVRSAVAGAGTSGSKNRQEINHHSFLNIEPNHVVLSALKPAEDGSGDWIVRAYETAGKAVEAQMWVEGVSAAWRSGLREQRGDEIDCQNGSLRFVTNPFEIVTLRLGFGFPSP